MKYLCVKCGHEVERLYIQYSPGNIQLVKCSNCMSVADEYIECELMILIIDLILHKPKAYRHLLFNLLNHKMFLNNSEDWSIFSLGVGIFGHVLLGNSVFLYSFLVLSRKSLEFVKGFSSYKEVLLAIIVSSYLKVYMLAISVWGFPSLAVYITDLFVMSSNLVALGVITKSSFRRCLEVADMESQRNQTEVTPLSTAPQTPTITSCRRKKNEDATFLEDIKDHIDEYIYASMDEHKSCFTKTIQKMFGMSKVVKQRTSDQQEIESILPLQTTISK